MNNIKKTVIIADDDNDDIELFESALKANCNDCEVFVANNGRQLFNLLTEVKQPNLIVLDINMPGMSGIDCLEKLKSDAKTLAIPVVIMSTATREIAAHKCLSLGAANFITKPSTLPLFKATVAKLYMEHLS